MEMSAPFCPSLGQAIKDAAKNAGKPLKQGGIYIATNGPRFETPAEIKAYAGMGADVVGMTLCPEVPLAREAGMSYAGLALPLNWAAGVKPEITLEHGNIKARQSEMVSLIIRALAQTKDTDCIPAKIF